MKYAVMFPMNDDKLQNTILSGLKKHGLDNEQLHFINIFEEVKYVYISPPYVYPKDNEKPALKKEIETTMKKIVESQLADKAHNYSCFFGESVKKAAIQYLENESFHGVVCAVRQKNSLEKIFLSSFTDYILQHSPFDVLVLK